MPFDGCTSLTIAPIIHDNISLDYLFYGCTNLTTYEGSVDAKGDFSNYKLPSNVTSMYSTFNGCEKITKAPTIPNTVTYMYNCFSHCIGLIEKPAIPSGVTQTEQEIFEGCTQFGF